MSCHLRGLSVLVTRPADQADKLCEMIEAAHGRPLRFPAMEIVATDDPRQARQLLHTIAPGNLLIFVSVNAVKHAFPLLPDELPLDLQIAAIGEATAAALEERGLPATLAPERRFDSEGLLALEALADMQNRKVIIVRGKGGRELLKQELEKRGAQVVYAEVYARRQPARSADNLVRGWNQMVGAVTVTSSEMLDNLLQMLGEDGAALLRSTPLVVLSERTAEHAFGLGCRKVWVTDVAGDRGILQALCEISEEQ
ncbi:uroporphyrinogen-III synthase [Thiolapillus sp.]